MRNDPSNFDFLRAEWPEVHDAAARAEASIYGDARTACFYARRALEAAMAWLYTYDAKLKLPYQDNLSALIHEPSFKAVAGDAVFTKARVPLKSQRQGIRYDDLPDEDKEQWDATEWSDDGSTPSFVEAEAVNKWLFNIDTVDKVLAHLMTHGLKVAGGDRLGKTILFAKNQAHADFIQERFDKNHPHLAGKFARVITFKTEYAQSLIDDFSVALQVRVKPNFLIFWLIAKLSLTRLKDFKTLIQVQPQYHATFPDFDDAAFVDGVQVRTIEQHFRGVLDPLAADHGDFTVCQVESDFLRFPAASTVVQNMESRDHGLLENQRIVQNVHDEGLKGRVVDPA